MTVFDSVRRALQLLEQTFIDQSGSESRRSDMLTAAHAEGHRMAAISGISRKFCSFLKQL
jgi:hypothetical protein